MGKTQKTRKSFILRLVVYAAITGVLVGATIAVFMTAARIVISFVFGAHKAADTPLAVVCLIMLSIMCCFAMAVLQTLCPAAKGSGIPLAEGFARGMLGAKWLSSAAGLAAGSLLAFLGGLPLGSEGPSIGIGGMLGDGIGRLTKRPAPFRRYLITGGASAGLATAFNAPLTGIAFAVEETHRRFSPDILLSALTAVTAAVVTAQAIFYGFGQIAYLRALDIHMGFAVLPYLEQAKLSGVWLFKIFGAALACGVVSALVAVGFNRAIGATSQLLSRIGSPLLRLLPAFVLTAICGAGLYLTVGSGEAMLAEIKLDTELWLLIVLLVLRIALTVTASGAGATGGLFLPMIAIGGLLGTLAARLCVLCGMPEQYAPNIIMTCIAAFFAASVRAPISAIALSVELTASFTNLLPCAAAVAAAMAVADLTRTDPLYERMMNELRKAAHKAKRNIARVTVAGVIKRGSIVCGKQLRNVLWPYNALIVSLTRNNDTIVPDGETKLRDGDEITVCAENVDPEVFRAELREFIFIPETIQTNEVRRNL